MSDIRDGWIRELGREHSIELELVLGQAPERWCVYARGRDVDHDLRQVYIEALPGVDVFEAIGEALNAYYKELFP